MPRFRCLLFAVGMLLPLLAQPPVGAQNNWPLDEVTLTNGAVYRGLILKESQAGMHFRAIRQLPGQSTFTFTTYFVPKEIRDTKRLGDLDRDDLRLKLAELDTDGRGERTRMESLALTRVELGGAKAWRYDADRFVLTSAAPEEVTRRAAVRLEQIYTCFARILPPRHNSARPTRIEMTGDLEQYRQLLRPSAGAVLNPAIYDPAANRVVVGTDLRRLGEELRRTRLSHAQQLVAVAQYEDGVRQLYKGSKAELDRFLASAQQQRRKVLTAEKENETAFDESTRRLFGILYHEAFHSYTSTFVYPPLSVKDIQAGQGTGELPRWLNEGLAQIVEDPLIEAGELRIGHADPQRLKRIQEGLAGQAAKDELIPIADLLRAGAKSFLVEQAGDTAISDRNYRTAWAVAFYLTFERRLVGGKDFDEYLKAVNTGTEPLKAFEAWVSQPVPAFEADWQKYLQKLQPDGTVQK